MTSKISQTLTRHQSSNTSRHPFHLGAIFSFSLLAALTYYWDLPFSRRYSPLNMSLRWLSEFIRCTILQLPDKEKSTMKKPVGERVVKMQNSLFLSLPLDVLYCIKDALPLSGRIMLSRTCRGLRHQLHNDCLSTFRNASAAERSQTLATLANFLPNHFHCVDCGALHSVNFEDVPIMDFYEPCLSLSTEYSSIDFYPSYTVYFRNVQLALKYTGLEGKYQRLRTRILQDFQALFTSKKSKIRGNFFAEPFITHDRFFLATTYIFHPKTEALNADSMSRSPVLFCPHLFLSSFIASHARPAKKAIYWAMTTKAVSLPRTKRFSCDYCPTDFLVWISHNEITFWVWQDLGTGASPEDPFWRSHTTAAFNDVPSSVFDYEHGSIMKTYLSSHFDRLGTLSTQAEDQNSREDVH